MARAVAFLPLKSCLVAELDDYTRVYALYYC